MRKLICGAVALLFILCLLPNPARAQITFVQQASTGNTGCATTCTTAAFGVNTTAGNSILTCIAGHQSSGSTNSLTSVTGQGTSSVLTSSLVNYGATTNYTNLWGECALATGITGGATTGQTCHVTTTTGGACVAYEVTAGEMTILYSTGTCSANCNQAVVFNASAGAVTTTVNNSFGLTMFAQDDSTGAGAYFGTVGTGWTQGVSVGGGSSEVGSEYQNQSSAGSITGNSRAGRAGVVAATMVVLEPAGSATVCKSCDLSKLKKKENLHG